MWAHSLILIEMNPISVVCNPMSDGSPGGRLHTLVLLDTGQTLQTKLSTSAEPELK